MAAAYKRQRLMPPLSIIAMKALFAGFFGQHSVKGAFFDPNRRALYAGLIWAGVTALFDLIAWVLISHRCTFKDCYVDYQPWITIVYAVILFSPLIAFGLIKMAG